MEMGLIWLKVRQSLLVVIQLLKCQHYMSALSCENVVIAIFCSRLVTWSCWGVGGGGGYILDYLRLSVRLSRCRYPLDDVSRMMTFDLDLYLQGH